MLKIMKHFFVYFGLTAFLLFMLTATSVYAYQVNGTYSVIFDTGYGTSSVNSGIKNLSPSSSAPLAFTSSYTTQGGSTASAAAGFWGYGTVDDWGAWLTEGTGVSQSHPNENFTAPAVIKINFDFYLSGANLHTAWYDAVFLSGMVGTGGYVQFAGVNDMSVGTFSTEGAYSTVTEVYNSSAPMNYYNDTTGSYYVEVKHDACNFGDACFQWLTEDNYLHFSGSYTFKAKNDGGPSTIYFTQNPVPTPEPATFLLLGLGLLGIVPFRKKMK
jgi:hypothetical protein